MKYLDSFNGWLGKIDTEINFESIEEKINILAKYYKKNSSPGQKLVISYDTRDFAKELATFIATIISKKGIKIFLSNRPCPSSVGVVSALHKKSLGTIVITGDEFNSNFIGIRAYDMQGYSLHEKDIFPYESEQIPNKHVNATFKELMKKGIIELFDPSIIYELFVHKCISFDEMKPSINQLMFNPYYGSGMFYFDYILLEQEYIHGMTIHSHKRYDFLGNEPNPKLMKKMMFSEMEEENMELGFVVSPDCTSFEFMVGNEVLSKEEILFFIIDLLKKEDRKIEILLSHDESQVDKKLLHNKSVHITTCPSKDFHTTLKNERFDIALDEFGRFYYEHHGCPDALLTGFYLFWFFNRNQVVTEQAHSYLKKIRKVTEE